MVIRYKNARAFSTTHADREAAKESVQRLASSFRIPTKAVDCRNGLYTAVDYIEKRKDIFYDLELIEKWRYIVNIRFQMENSTGSVFEELEKNLNYGDPQDVIAVKTFIKCVFADVNPRFRLDIWGMWNLNVKYTFFLNSFTIKEKIKTRDGIKYTYLSKYPGIAPVDELLRKWCGLSNAHILPRYPLNSLKQIQSNGKALHLLSFCFVFILFCFDYVLYLFCFSHTIVI